ncbi:MAG: hypothetical protein Edafosvirus4_64 [Edafosvirus sp.]|uniref:RCC1-like domain-containing protein n=1 Tax=Edafosvirus sp. TaxID=2487765 RepID=A0A3G4ZT47_9VIRU|nr:MAG: hypothetical protein Edafosvirus4_64 [Edafosvirus sp.]
MDDDKLLFTIPKDLLMIITSYNPVLIFNLPESFYTKYDWYALIKNNFSLIYSKRDTTNNDMMKTYIWNCIKDDLNCEISAGPSNIFIKKNTGLLMSCGRNDYGQLGNKSQLNYVKSMGQPYFEQVKLPNPKDCISQIICSGWRTIIRLNNGKLLNIGCDLTFEKDSCDRYKIDQFKEIENIPNNISQVVCGLTHVIILLTDGTLMACGSNGCGEIGCGEESWIKKFTKIDNIPKNIVEIVCGQSHTIIRLSDGTLMSTGSNYCGQLGHNDTKSRNKFEEIKNIPKNIVQIACGEDNTIIRLTDGTLMGCGDNSAGQLGIDGIVWALKFEEIKNIPKNIVEIACGNEYSMIRLTNGILMSCGSNMDGALGHGDNKRRNIFTKIEDVSKNIIQFICRGGYSMIRLTDDTIMCCGNNEYDQFGNGSHENENKFKKVFNINEIVENIK